jgi:DNA repair exonuclease SbcCD ATPase subunit
MTFDLERARGLRDFLQDDCAEVGDVWAEMIAEIERLRAENAWLKSDREFQSEEQAARISDLEIEITGLKADLEQSEEIKRLKDELENYGDHYACLLISKDAQIKELEGMLSIRTEELDIAHSVARSEKEMHEKELAAFARRIKELEDALVEGLTNFLHYRASCYDPARRCPYAKECDDCSTWDACGHVEKFRSEARRRLQAEGKIGSGGGA